MWQDHDDKRAWPDLSAGGFIREERPIFWWATGSCLLLRERTTRRPTSRHFRSFARDVVRIFTYTTGFVGGVGCAYDGR